MPIRKEDYHPEWEKISLQVRTEAHMRCEWCGVSNRSHVFRTPKPVQWVKDEFSYHKDWIPAPVFYRNGIPDVSDGPRTTENASEWEFPTEMSWSRLKFYGIKRIILTVAHLDRNSKNNTRDNLAALCQRCHLRHDIRQHVQNRLYGRYHNREHQLKLELNGLLPESLI